jgi:hypothetical protein
MCQYKLEDVLVGIPAIDSKHGSIKTSFEEFITKLTKPAIFNNNLKDILVKARTSGIDTSVRPC